MVEDQQQELSLCRYACIQGQCSEFGHREVYAGEESFAHDSYGLATETFEQVIMKNDLRTKLQEAKSCCENEILEAINKFSEATGLQVVEIDYKTEDFGAFVNNSVEIHTKI